MKRILATVCVILICFTVLASAFQNTIVPVSFADLRTATNAIEGHQVDVISDLQFIGALSKAYRSCAPSMMEYFVKLWEHTSETPVILNTVHVSNSLPTEGTYTIYFDAGEENDTHYSRYIYVLEESKPIITGNFLTDLISPVFGIWAYISQTCYVLGIAIYALFMTAVDEILALVSIVTGYGSLLFGDISILPN